jgi:hypothetical protein
MLLNKPVGLEIRLYAYNHFFQQNRGFRCAKVTYSVVLGL